jgi:hypothetical protein
VSRRCFLARPAISVAPVQTIGCSWRRCCGWSALGRLGAICPRCLGIGIACFGASAGFDPKLFRRCLNERSRSVRNSLSSELGSTQDASLRLKMDDQDRCWAMCLFISNMLTLSLPPKMARSLSSARISRLFSRSPGSFGNKPPY